MKFETLRLAESLMQGIAAAGYTIPTPIQDQAIPHILAGRHVLGIAQTGTGKSAAFALPIMQRLMTRPRQHSVLGARALVLAPTRELALQIVETFRELGKFTGLKTVGVYGGVHQAGQTAMLKAGVDILVATPGRLLDLRGQGAARLTLVEVVVLDEADRMLDIGFLPDIRKILAHVPEDRQAMMFSATMPNEIRKFAREVLIDPVQVQVTPQSSAAPNVEHWVHFVRPDDKVRLLATLLKQQRGTRSLVFTRTKRGAEKLSRDLRKCGVKAAAMHGDKTQEDRNRALAAFKAASTPVLVATDVAARGLHVDDIQHVFNFDMAVESETYVHRIGRTGRAGATGTAVSFCTPKERPALKAVERLIGAPLQRADLPHGFEELPDSDEEHATERRGHGRSASAAHGDGHRRHSEPRPSQAHAKPAPAERTHSHSGTKHAQRDGEAAHADQHAEKHAGDRAQSRDGQPAAADARPAARRRRRRGGRRKPSDSAGQGGPAHTAPAHAAQQASGHNSQHAG